MTAPKPIKLVINADDYGYFPSISRGILEAANAGGLTATGILANSPKLTTQLKWLDTIKGLDLGVHLNLTYGHPITEVMAEKLSFWNGSFPDVYSMCLSILTRKISIQNIRNEWHAQIQACHHKKLLFLNAHEHIHMLPILFPLVLELAQEYQIPYIRLTQAEWLGFFGVKSLARNTLLHALHAVNQRKLKFSTPTFLGLSQSGKLNYEYLETILPKLKPGKSYELMCHPGHFEPNEILDTKLKSYHDWDGELALLINPKVQALYEKYRIHLCNYQQLTE